MYIYIDFTSDLKLMKTKHVVRNRNEYKIRLMIRIKYKLSRSKTILLYETFKLHKKNYYTFKYITIVCQ